ncbi:uncharacterized protein L201_004648 [Kwoniella dendrophila CBS 6074]|uniref:Selenoprotein W n=1 Tax=Kwoniella dendrophila CBS 6074 TaxID=1295534 RepID=A0AAX4JXX3_9TREE
MSSSSNIICEDCEPLPSSSSSQIQAQAQAQTQPASSNTMAHEESPHKSNGIELPSEFKPPVPVDPPSKAGHATEFTMTGPPTPTIDGKPKREPEQINDNEDNLNTGSSNPNSKEEKGELTAPKPSGTPRTGLENLPKRDPIDDNTEKGNTRVFSSADGKESAFKAPNPIDVKPSIIIEFCDRCRWAPRATWIQTELFLTFPNPLIRSITLLPLNAPETGGRFRVWVDIGKGKGDELVWDRKTEGGFPELKILKQRIRNLIQPDLNLGHSDIHGK